MTVGDAFLATLSEDYGGPLSTDPEVLTEWHDSQAGDYPEFGWSAAQWSGYDASEQADTAESYLTYYFYKNDEIAGKVGTRPDGYHARLAHPEVDNFLATVNRLLGEKPGKGKAKSNGSAGDKWVSPGRLVCSWPDLDTTTRSVMFVMAAHGDNKGQNIWISQESIAGYLGVTKRTVQRCMDKLETRGAITRTAKHRQHRPTTWRLNHGPEVT